MEDEPLIGGIEVDAQLGGALHAGRGHHALHAPEVFVDVRAGDMNLMIFEQSVDARAGAAVCRAGVDGDGIDPRRRMANFELGSIVRADGGACRNGDEENEEESGEHALRALSVVG